MPRHLIFPYLIMTFILIISNKKEIIIKKKLVLENQQFLNFFNLFLALCSIINPMKIQKQKIEKVNLN